MSDTDFVGQDRISDQVPYVLPPQCFGLYARLFPRTYRLWRISGQSIFTPNRSFRGVPGQVGQWTDSLEHRFLHCHVRKPVQDPYPSSYHLWSR